MDLEKPTAAGEGAGDSVPTSQLAADQVCCACVRCVRFDGVLGCGDGGVSSLCVCAKKADPTPPPTNRRWR